jgi:hypothetical protein
MNWPSILGNHYSGRDQDEKTDRAKIGIYYLLDWLASTPPKKFSKSDVMRAAANLEITISDDNETIKETIDNLLFVLAQAGYLKLKHRKYQVIWDKNSQPRCHKIDLKNELARAEQEFEHENKPRAVVNLGENQATYNSSRRVTKELQIKASTDHGRDDSPFIQENDVYKTIDEKIDHSTKPKRDKVFVSYSHVDQKWLSRIQKHLKPFEQQGILELWDDTRIRPGADWRKEVSNAIDSAKVALMLVSADFLASDFVTNNELPPLLAASEKEGTIILPIIVKSCLFEGSVLDRFQSVNSPSQPLIGMSENAQEKLFAKVAKTIRESLNL